ncbi:hypothetical protein MHPYR_250035 [uncultured Mycobacterium sp.]|uniref:Uncharacterized protein n=1 Tax=uncultured Mycobacterium sp. TaxID=171292 RepID=A0A1Y5PAC5_9MYCO|nr:hypothetical protein MHPYR_250035 [uncultured Mycobacterium sp.]
MRNSGAVSAMKSVQNLPGSSSAVPSAGSARSTSSSTKPNWASLPAQELSAANTIRWPRSARMAARPMHWFVGPYADSGQNMIVNASEAMAVPSDSSGPDTDYRAITGSGVSLTELSNGGTGFFCRYSQRRNIFRHGDSIRA